MDFKEFLTDRITLIRKDGSTHENVEAGIQPDMILFADPTLPVAVGDRVKRHLPSGEEEILIITDPGFHQAFGSIGAHYQARYEREDSVKSTVAPSNVTYNVSGPHARVNIGSVDQSTNVGDVQIRATFDELRTLVRQEIEDATERQRLLAQIDDLQQAQGTDRFSDVYKEFMAKAANHMTILAPFLPALTNLL